MLRFGSFVGFKPPYFYDRALHGRLYRATMPSLVLWGEADHMVPLAHSDAFADGLAACQGLHKIAGAGHALVLEQPDAAADLVLGFLAKQPQ